MAKGKQKDKKDSNSDDDGDPLSFYGERMEAGNGAGKKKGKRAPSAAATPKGSDEDERAEGAALKPQRSAPAKLALPKGVVLISAADELERDAEMTKLIRAPRYFDDVEGVASSTKCFHCGRVRSAYACMPACMPCTHAFGFSLPRPGLPCHAMPCPVLPSKQHRGAPGNH